MNEELLKRMQEAHSPEELLSMAEMSGIRLSREKAEEYYASFHKRGELDESELDSVSGGGCGGYQMCPACNRAEPLWMFRGGRLEEIRCPSCSAVLDYDTSSGIYTVIKYGIL